jgi:hypothetical protein
MEECNLPHERTQRFQFYPGRLVDSIPKMLADGRVLLSMAHYLQRRVDLKDDTTEVRDFFNNWSYTGDLNAQKGQEVKMVLTTYADGTPTPVGRKYLELINPSRVLVDGAVNLEIDRRYEKLKGAGVIVTDTKDIAKILCEPMSKGDVKDSLFWGVALRHPDFVSRKFAIKGLFDRVVNYTFEEGAKRSIVKMMGVYLDKSVVNAEMRACYVNGLEDRSGAGGWDSLDGDSGRSVGIAPEALSAQGKGITDIRAYTMADVQKARKELDELTQIRPELVNETRTLLGKL